ncbi:MAG: hypothetical protein MUE40_01530 [Anaerolineae bacterium]|nr:hypothetical protein [Anaerolineae bacterium]
MRRILLLVALVVLGLAVAALRGSVPVSVRPEAVLVAGVIAALVALVALALEVRRAVHHPTPEEPPISQKPIIPPDDGPPPPPPTVRPVVPPPPPPVNQQVVIERALKAAEEAEAFAHKTNGRVRISLELDEDDQDD